MALSHKLAVASLKHLLAIEDQRTRQLNLIQSTVQANLEGPYHTALIHLHKANSSEVSPQSRAYHLGLAEERFIDALGNFEKTDPLQRSWAGVYLAGICKLDNRSAEALGWAVQAHEDAAEATRRECQAATDRATGKISRRLKLNSPSAEGGALVTVGLVASFVGVGLVVVPAAAAAVGGMYGYRKYAMSRANTKLEELSAHVENVGSLARTLGADNVHHYALHRQEDHYVGFF